MIILYSSFQSDSWVGNSIALVLALITGMMFTCLRKYVHVQRIPAIVSGAVLSAIVILPWVNSLPGSFFPLVCLVAVGCVIKPLASVLILNAPRYISAPEVGLFLLLEAAVAPLWAWLFIGESLHWNTLLGGVVVLAAVVFHLTVELRSSRV